MSVKDTPLLDGLKREAVRRHRPGDLRAAELVMAYKGLPEGVQNPTVMLHALRGAARAMTITDKALRLYEALFSHTNIKDWHPRRLALVWPSDEALMREIGISDRSNLQKLMRQLRDAALIAYRDSPNKARYGRRNNGDGNIDIEHSYGIILNPIAGLYNTLVQISADYDLRRRYRAMLRRDLRSVRTEAREILEAIACAMDVETAQVAEDEVDILEELVRKSNTDAELETAIRRYRDCVDRLRCVCAAEADSPLDQYTGPSGEERKQMEDYLSNNPRKRGRNNPAIRSITSPSPKQSNRLGQEHSNGNEASGTQGTVSKADRPEGKVSSSDSGSEHRYEPSKVSLDMVKACLPYIIGQDIRDDHGFYQIFDILKDHCDYYGVPNILLDDARLVMGREISCACMAVVMSKHATIKRPANYLRGMMAKYRDGALRVERSLFGIIAESKKPKSVIQQLRLDHKL